jgi:two-component system, CitB family, sensor histidine kinase DctS
MIDETSDEESIVQFLKDHFKHDAISGLLLGKRSRAKEMGVQLNIADDSYLTQIIENYRPADLVTIVGNLIDNALEACQSVELKHVTCLIQGDIDHLYIRVQDTGIGMSETEKGKIFEYGFSSKAREGRGIGLALVKQLVEANNGKICVQSASGTGTTIEIRIERQQLKGT